MAAVCRRVCAKSAKLGYKVVSGLFVISPLQVMSAKQTTPTRMIAVTCLSASLKSNAQRIATEITVKREIRSNTAARKFAKKSESTRADNITTIAEYLVFRTTDMSARSFTLVDVNHNPYFPNCAPMANNAES